MQYISATQARQSFFGILDQIERQKSNFAIRKRGTVIAYISHQKPVMASENILDFAGAWGKLTQKDLQEIEQLYQRRTSSGVSRPLPEL